MLGVAVAALPACDGLFAGIYDDPVESGDSNFTVVDAALHTGRIFVDATSYETWNYVDLHEQRIVASEVEAEAPDSWDFAVHRYDAKTDGAGVLETAYADFDALIASGAVPAGDYVEDVWTTDRITVDMSHMMDGYLVYAESYYNPELSKWLDVDTSVMPPIYTASNRVYVLQLRDGTCAALLLSRYMDDAGVKGFLTIDYLYPFEP